MPTIVHGFDWPDRIVIGTIGAPGSRAFYLQARTGNHLVTVALEKEQSAILARTMDELLDELMLGEGNSLSIPASTPRELIDNDPLDQPVELQFRTGTISLGWDPTTAQIVLEAYPIVEVDDVSIEYSSLDADEVEPPEMLVVRMPVGTARAFATRTLEIVGGGRPPCPLCGLPIDPGGHTCPEPDELA
jgi:uncharacterized repeat protein (TIGR03847 family)